MPVFLRDASGTPLGSDAGAGNRIQGVAFKVSYSPPSAVAGISFARAGVLQPLTPLYETTIPSTNAVAYVGSFSETSNAIPLTLNGTGSGDRIGTLNVTLSASAPTGSVVTLTIDSATATLSNQAGTLGETVANNGLSLVSGSVNVTTPAAIATPTGVNAVGNATPQVMVAWNAVANAHHYEVWRNPGNVHLLPDPAGASFTDNGVTGGNAYVYQVRAAADANGTTLSAFSAPDYATTIFFTDDPLMAGTTIIQAQHLRELRQAVNALRLAAGLGSINFGADPAGALVRASDITDLRTRLNEARSQLLLATISFADPTLTPNSSIVKASHFQDIRNAVK